MQQIYLYQTLRTPEFHVTVCEKLSLGHQEKEHGAATTILEPFK
jgi:hypothetical protein